MIYIIHADPNRQDDLTDRTDLTKQRDLDHTDPTRQRDPTGHTDPTTNAATTCTVQPHSLARVLLLHLVSRQMASYYCRSK